LQTVSLTKDYGRNRALADLNLEIAPGEIFGLLGPNGSGKSTALRLLLGFMRPTAGKATIAGFDCWADSVAVRRRVAYLPGELRLYETMTGRQLITFLGDLRSQRYGEELVQIARRLDIDIDRPLTQMSSGMKRKVALLSVLLPKTDLLILDEPTNTLDPLMRDELLKQLRQARERGQAVLFSSHVLSEVEQVCDRVGLLRHGRLVYVQNMSEQLGRRVYVRFNKAPASWPDSFGPAPMLQADGSYQWEHAGDLQPLLEWLGRQAVADVKIESAGLASLYQKFHGGSE
jgi:ABC-2 type transport system ATP-binding protein